MFYKKSPVWFALLVFVSAAVDAQPMSGTYPVGPGGPGVDSFATVQEAASAMNARGLSGDVVFPLTRFIYSGPVALRNVVNSRDYVTTFLPKDSGATIDAAGARYAFSVESTHNVTVRQMRFQGARDTGSACIRFLDSDSGMVWACRMVSDSAQSGLRVERAERFRLDSSRVQGAMRATGSRGLDFRDCRFLEVRKCSILGTLNTGVSIVGGGDNVTMMTGVKTASDTGFKVANSPRISVTGCAVIGRTDNGLHVVNSPGASFDSCLMNGTQKQGAYFESCDSLKSLAIMLFGTAEQGARVVRSRGCEFMRLTIQTGPKRGLVLDHSPGCLIDSLQVVNVHSDTAIGVLLDSSPNSVFRWAMLYGDYGRAFSVSNSPRTRFAHARVHGSAAQAAMTFSRSSGVIVSPCSLVCAAPASVVLLDGCNDDTLARMTILGVTDVGIAALNLRGLVVANSCIRGWTDLGVSLTNVQSPRLYYNTIVGPDGAGNVVIDLANVTGAEARNNIVWNRGRYGSTCYGISEAFPFAPGASDYNDLYTSESGSVARAGDTVFPGLAEWRGHGSAPDAHSLSGDPLFVPGDDYHLSSGSPCRNAGIPIPGFAYDIEFDERDTISPDIGADEFSPGAVSEGPALKPVRPAPAPSIVRGVFRLTIADCRMANVGLLDISGRKVLDLRPGANDVSRVAPGVYFVRSGNSCRRVVIQ